jgi:acetylornithine deacetylase
MKEDDLVRYLEAQKESVGDFLSELLAVKSESGDERAALDLLCIRLKDFGLTFEAAPVSNAIKTHKEFSDPVKGVDYTGRYNVIARTGSGGKKIALNTHIDVVPPSPGQMKAYEPEQRDGRIYARGACDAKGQIAAAVFALKAAHDLGCRNSIEAHIVIEEEFGGNGTLSLLEEYFKGAGFADVLVNLEPTDLKFKPSVRGAVWFDMAFAGVAGHAGAVGNTESAIYKAQAAIGILQEYHAELYERSKDTGRFKGIPAPMPLNIGMFQAGVWPSMVPSEARIQGIMGFLPNKTKDEIMAEMNALFHTEKTSWIGERMSIRHDYRHNGFELPDDHFLVRSMRASMRDAGIDDSPTAMTASTDAIFYVEKGIPSIVFGPGAISDAHSIHENIAISDVLKAAEVLVRLGDTLQVP